MKVLPLARQPALWSGFAMGGKIEGPSPQRILYLDGWRGAAIILVVAGHFFLQHAGIATLGVEVFFVLSGRLMAEILFVEKYPLPRFFLKRFARIYPALVVFVIGAFLVLHGGPEAFKPKAAVAGLLLIYNYLGPYVSTVPALDHLWSLCVEEHSYILLAVVAWATRRNRKAAVWAIGILTLLSFADSIVSGVVFHHSLQKLWRSDAHVGSVLVSAWMYLVARPYFAERPKIGAWIPVVGLITAVFIFLFVHDLSNTVGTAVLALMVCTLEVAPAGLQAVLSWRGLTFAGTLSYSLYLWQQPASKFVDAGVLNPWLGIALSLAAAFGSLYVVEKPARAFINSRVGRLKIFREPEDLGEVRVARA